MLGKAKGCPKTRKVPDVEVRIVRLEAYEAWRPPTKVDFETLLGKEAWDHYWSLWDALNTALHEAQIVADRMGAVVKEKMQQRK
jgi:hypothetical protein